MNLPIFALYLATLFARKHLYLFFSFHAFILIEPFTSFSKYEQKKLNGEMYALSVEHLSFYTMLLLRIKILCGKYRRKSIIYFERYYLTPYVV